VAVILDPFSELAFRYEWTSVPVTPERWREVLTAAHPHLLFVESARRGNAGAWRVHMTGADEPSPELRELVAWCRENAIPTVFWNNADPPNYDRFLATARLFDRVFTVDADTIPAYRRDLGHDRVGLLPFAAQPRIHNPVRHGAGRVYDVAYADDWDDHVAHRAQMRAVLEPASDFGVHLYSRPPGVAAYSSYKVFLDLHPPSATACPRGLFELSAAQTAVVTAAAAAVEPIFGDDVTVVCSSDETRAALSTLLQHDEVRERMALRAHRRVFDEHLYAHRVDAVLAAVGIPTRNRRRTVSAVVPTNRPAQLDHVVEFVGRQSHEAVQLVVILHGFAADAAELTARAKDHGVDDVVVLTADGSLTLGACMNLGVDAAGGDLVAKMDDDNFYGRHYLRDLVRALDYTDAEVVGKWAHLVHLEGSGATLLRFPHAEHRYTSLVQGGTLVTRRETAAAVRFDDLPRRVDTTFLDKIRARGGSVYSADRFNFVSVRRADTGRHTWTISDKEILARSSRLVFYGEPYVHAEI
jgi:nicotinamidase-related amidase